jgi:phosphohistidine phosphatase
MARKLAEKEKSPGVIVTSPAFRALETALIFAGEYKIDAGDIIMNNSMYSRMNLQNLSAIISKVSEDAEAITLFGHNPSFTEIANNLCKHGCDSIPKSGIVCISFKIMLWHEIGRNIGNLEYFLKPE